MGAQPHLQVPNLITKVPNLIYRNNKENDDTRSEKSQLKISREGNFLRSGIDVIDEIEIFEGNENPLILMQAYTKVFKCEYHLATFPFDTQVCGMKDLNPPKNQFLGVPHQVGGG